MIGYDIVELTQNNILNKALLGTKLKHAKGDMGISILKAIRSYIQFGDYTAFVQTISNHTFGFGARKEVENYCIENPNNNIILELLDSIYIYCLRNINTTDYQARQLINNYINGYRTIAGTHSLNSLDEQIHKNPTVLSYLLPYISSLVNMYLSSLNVEEVFELDTIPKIEITETAKKLSNLDVDKLKLSYSGNLLGGNIQIKSDKGYKYEGAKQEDAVLSIVKNPNCFINVVADGAGGSEQGDRASIETIKQLEEWFNNLDERLVSNSNNIGLIESLLNNELIRINNTVMQKYPKSLSTVVIALTINEYTIIANVGDSTCYSYDFENNKLEELTVLDSASNGLSYEDARKNPNNFKITGGIGLKQIEQNTNYAHLNIIYNKGQKIVLSSDGVTDLISENNFKKLLIDDASAEQIVDSAVNNPDIIPGIKKKADNTSAIVVKLPDYNTLKRTGRSL